MRKKSKKLSDNSIIKPILILAVVGVAIYFFSKYQHKTQVVENVTTPPPAQTASTISITKESIKEANFTGTRVIVKGTSKIAPIVQNYIDQTIEDFRKTANTDVPEMRQKFGADSSLSKYTIDFEGKYIKSRTTESVIINQYVYTGGANGLTIYKVFTISSSDGSLLPLSYMIKPSEQDVFTAYVKKSLINWRPEGSTTTVVFPDDVNSLTFASFTDWSLDDKFLTLYFDQDSIAPGAVGAVAYPLPLTSIKKFLIER